MHDRDRKKRLKMDRSIDGKIGAMESTKKCHEDYSTQECWEEDGSRIEWCGTEMWMIYTRSRWFFFLALLGRRMAIDGRSTQLTQTWKNVYLAATYTNTRPCLYSCSSFVPPRIPEIIWREPPAKFVNSLEQFKAYCGFATDNMFKIHTCCIHDSNHKTKLSNFIARDWQTRLLHFFRPPYSVSVHRPTRVYISARRTSAFELAVSASCSNECTIATSTNRTSVIYSYC